MRRRPLAGIELRCFQQEGDLAYFDYRDEFGQSRAGFVILWDGVLRAYENRCPHWKTPLNTHGDGVLAKGEGMLICHTHGALFRPEDGHCLSGPCEGDGLGRLEVQEKENRAWVYRPGLSFGL